MFLSRFKELLTESTDALAKAREKLNQTIEAADDCVTRIGSRCDETTQPNVHPMRRDSDWRRRL